MKALYVLCIVFMYTITSAQAPGSVTNVTPTEATTAGFEQNTVNGGAHIDQDGNLDLIMAGNEGDFKPQYGKLDANDGLVLFGDGNGNFNLIGEHKSLGLKGNVRSIDLININNHQHLLFGINKDKPVLLQIKK